MSEVKSIWPRPHHVPCGRTASVVLFALADDVLDLSQPLEHHLPSELFDALDIHLRRRVDEPEWFASFFTPAGQRIAESDLGTAPAPDRARVAYSVVRELEDPPDLGYLQAAWAAATWLCDRGATAVLDAHAIRWFGARELLDRDPHRGFELRHEIKIVFETEPTGQLGHLTHTRGLAKFGRQDFVLIGVQRAMLETAGVLLNQLALQAALGKPSEACLPTGHEDRGPLPFETYEPGARHPELHLNNDGLVLDVRQWKLS